MFEDVLKTYPRPPRILFPHTCTSGITLKCLDPTIIELSILPPVGQGSSISFVKLAAHPPSRLEGIHFTPIAFLRILIDPVKFSLVPIACTSSLQVTNFVVHKLCAAGRKSIGNVI